jgi:hypothetical protein
MLISNAAHIHAGTIPEMTKKKVIAVSAMTSGKAMTSRESHEVRHIIAARQARSGCPKWKKDATKPRLSSMKLTGNANIDRKGADKTGSSIFNSATKNNRPCAIPASVVKKIIENCGRIICHSLLRQSFP